MAALSAADGARLELELVSIEQLTGLTAAQYRQLQERLYPSPVPLGQVFLSEARAAFARFLEGINDEAPSLQRLTWTEGRDEYRFDCFVEFTAIFGCYSLRIGPCEMASPIIEQTGCRWIVRFNGRDFAATREWLRQNGQAPFLTLYIRLAAQHETERVSRQEPDRAPRRPLETHTAELMAQYELMARHDLPEHQLERCRRWIELAMRLGAERFVNPVAVVGQLRAHEDAVMGLPSRYLHPFRRDAEVRGQVLLREWLSPEQRAQYDRHGSFEVKGQSGRRYRIRDDRAFNIDVLDKRGRVTAQLCFAPEGDLVSGDVMLAQKLALETNERAALSVANQRSGGWF